jgi:hypothetical protein
MVMREMLKTVTLIVTLNRQGFVHRHDLCLIALDGNTATQKRGKIRQGNKKQKNKKLKTNQEKTNAHQTVKQKRQRCIN